eukprot:m.50241 g.50241  ORF g.50241 m.50241 type:complete len:213 (-) comp11150_c0_seq3:485-1123(-)
MDSSPALRMLESTAAQDRKIEKGKKLGGFHVSQLPFTDEATKAIKKLKSGQFVELAIVHGTHIHATVTGPVEFKAPAIQEVVHRVEPRFYVINGKKLLFIYSCPDNSSRKDRMLNSTSKPHVLAVLKSLGVKPNVQLEISDVDDITKENILGKSPSAASLEKPKLRRSSSATAAIPTELHGSLSAFMAQSLGKKSGATAKKKIVMAPAGAYG